MMYYIDQHQKNMINSANAVSDLLSGLHTLCEVNNQRRII